MVELRLWGSPMLQDRIPLELFRTIGIKHWLGRCATLNSNRLVQKLRTLIGNPRSSQQIMGQLPICCCLKAKKFNDFSRACVDMYVKPERLAFFAPEKLQWDSTVCF